MFKLNDSTRRMLRTGIDTVLAVATLILIVIPFLDSTLTQLGHDDLRVYTATIAGTLGGLVVTFTKIRNFLEDRGIIPAILKAPASQGANPVPNDLPVQQPDVPVVPDVPAAPDVPVTPDVPATSDAPAADPAASGDSGDGSVPPDANALAADGNGS